MKASVEPLKSAIRRAASPALSAWLGPLLLLALTLLMLGDVLFASNRTVLAGEGTDLSAMFLPWRHFGFTELREGNLALWNPFVFSGTPFFGGAQSALLYPVNWLHVILPLGLAVNLEIALHLFLSGFFTYLWCRYRGVTRTGAFLAGVLYMFCGPRYLHMYAGHLPHLAAMTWPPLIFLVIDVLSRTAQLRWCLIGVAAVALQILAGHPQFTYYTGLAALVYTGLCLTTTGQRLKLCVGFVLIYAGGAAVSSVQLMTTIGTASESVRAGGTALEFAASSSLPPENLLTFLLPFIWGDLAELPYFGRWHLWEVSLFTGVAGLSLALYGLAYGDRTQRRFSGTMVLLLTVLALGASTPIFRSLHEFLPGYNLFRAPSRFGFLVSLFLAMLAGVGFGRLTTESKWRRWPALASLGVAIVLLSLGVALRYSAQNGADGLWGALLSKLGSSEGSLRPLQDYHDSRFIVNAGLHASRQLFAAAVVLILVSGGFLLKRVRAGLSYSLALLVVLEMLLFGAKARATVPLSPEPPAAWRQLTGEQLGDSCVLDWDPRSANFGMWTGIRNVWGYDVTISKRYAEFMYATQGLDPDQASHKLKFKRAAKILRILRCSHVLLHDQEPPVLQLPDPLPRLLLLNDYLVRSGRDRVLRALSEPSFDPMKQVLLESPPGIEVEKPGDPGTAVLVRESTDELEITADLSQPAILVVTDSYSKGWRAVPLPGSCQTTYEVMPANYILRAIPLEAGRHHFRLEYSPASFRTGAWISLFSLAIYVSAGVVSLRRRGTRRSAAGHALRASRRSCGLRLQSVRLLGARGPRRPMHRLSNRWSQLPAVRALQVQPYPANLAGFPFDIW